MAVSRKAMTEGIRTFLFPGTPGECKFDNPSVTAFRETAVTAPFTQGSRGCSRTSAFVLSSRNISGIVTGGGHASVRIAGLPLCSKTHRIFRRRFLRRQCSCLGKNIKKKPAQGALPKSRPPKNPPAASPEASQNIPARYGWFHRKCPDRIIREALIKSARAGSERFCSQARFGKWRNTLCISHFSNRRLGAKDPLPSRRRFIQSFPRKGNARKQLLPGVITF